MLILKWIKEWVEWEKKIQINELCKNIKESFAIMYRPCALPKVIRSGFLSVLNLYSSYFLFLSKHTIRNATI
jgi:hypothetical protein